MSCGGGSIQPNIILISMDDAGWRDFGFHGSAVRTPTLDQMARQGIKLDHFYVSPVCTPTRAGLMIGRPASRVGIFGAINAVASPPLARDQVTIGEIFFRAGYDTALTGKWHLGNTPDFGPSAYGFNHSHGFLGPWVDYYTHRTMEDKIDWHRNGEYIDQEGHATDLISNEAINFLTTDRDKSKPFFLYVSFNAPHLPLQEEEKWLDLYRDQFETESRRFSAAMVTHVDDSIRHILETLDQEGVAQNTLVIFFSDNGGEPPGEKSYLRPKPTYKTTPSTEFYSDNSPLRGTKGSLYEGGIRVAAIAYWPGKLTPGTFSEPVAIYDLLPTLASLANIPIPEKMIVEGLDFWPALVKGESLDDRVLYWHVGQQFSIQKNGWKLIHRRGTTSETTDELFHLEQDPHEKQEVSGIYPEKLYSLKQEMVRQQELDEKNW